MSLSFPTNWMAQAVKLYLSIEMNRYHKPQTEPRNPQSEPREREKIDFDFTRERMINKIVRIDSKVSVLFAFLLKQFRNEAGNPFVDFIFVEMGCRAAAPHPAPLGFTVPRKYPISSLLSMAFSFCIRTNRLKTFWLVNHCFSRHRLLPRHI